MLTHLPMDGDGSWALDEAKETFGGPVELATPGGTYSI
jgi:hypothetical protein